MTTSVEILSGCRAKLHIELPPDRVSAERKKVAGEFQRYAQLPGYRPGKAPLRLVESRFADKIQAETINNLLRDALREAISKESLEVWEVSQIERAELDSVGALQIEATAVLEPEFPIPDYSSLEIELAEPKVDDQQVEEFLLSLREPYATFDPIEGRPAQLGDFAVANYSLSLEGKKLAEILPEAPSQLHGGTNAWIRLAQGALLPGFTEAILGTQPGTEKTFSLAIPAEFPLQALANKTVEVRFELLSLHARSLPPLDDALAEKIHPGKSANELKAWARERLLTAAQSFFERQKRNLAVRSLLEKTTFDIPATELERETRSVLYDIIRENQSQGVSDEELRKHQDELIGLAQQNARDRVRAKFLLLRIARAEKLDVSEAELTQLVVEIAHSNQIPVKKLVTDLRKRGGFADLREQILRRKALDLLASRVTLKTPPAPTAG